MPMPIVVTGLVLMVCQIAVTVYLVRVIGRMAQIDARVSRLAEAMALLTETTESSFGVVATQLERMAVTASNRRGTPARTTTARVAGAARRGRSVGEIAAKEGVSEGEVRLRLHLAEHARPAAGH